MMTHVQPLLVHFWDISTAGCLFCFWLLGKRVTKQTLQKNLSRDVSMSHGYQLGFKWSQVRNIYLFILPLQYILACISIYNRLLTSNLKLIIHLFNPQNKNFAWLRPICLLPCIMSSFFPRLFLTTSRFLQGQDVWFNELPNLVRTSILVPIRLNSELNLTFMVSFNVSYLAI